MVLTEFLQNLTSGNLFTLSQQAAAAPQTITGQIGDTSASFQQAANIFESILKGGEIPETFRQATVTQNLLGLGQASIDISAALSEQVAIREQQLARTQESIRNQQLSQNVINEQFTKTFGELTKSVGDIGKGDSDPLKFLTDNPLIGGIGIGGLLVGGVVLLVLLR